jgi:hypothetical protein
MGWQGISPQTDHRAMEHAITIVFDTLKYVETLKSAGVPEALANVEVEALTAALGESAHGRRTPKGAIEELKTELSGVRHDQAGLKSEFVMLKVLLILAMAGVMLLAVQMLFG